MDALTESGFRAMMPLVSAAASGIGASNEGAFSTVLASLSQDTPAAAELETVERERQEGLPPQRAARPDAKADGPRDANAGVLSASPPIRPRSPSHRFAAFAADWLIAGAEASDAAPSQTGRGEDGPAPAALAMRKQTFADAPDLLGLTIPALLGAPSPHEAIPVRAAEPVAASVAAPSAGNSVAQGAGLPRQEPAEILPADVAARAQVSGSGAPKSAFTPARPSVGVPRDAPQMSAPAFAMGRMAESANVDAVAAAIRSAVAVAGHEPARADRTGGASGASTPRAADAAPLAPVAPGYVTRPPQIARVSPGNPFDSQRGPIAPRPGIAPGQEIRTRAGGAAQPGVLATGWLPHGGPVARGTLPPVGAGPDPLNRATAHGAAPRIRAQVPAPSAPAQSDHEPLRVRVALSPPPPDPGSQARAANRVADRAPAAGDTSAAAVAAPVRQDAGNLRPEWSLHTSVPARSTDGDGAPRAQGSATRQPTAPAASPLAAPGGAPGRAETHAPLRGANARADADPPLPDARAFAALESSAAALRAVEPRAGRIETPAEVASPLSTVQRPAEASAGVLSKAAPLATPAPIAAPLAEAPPALAAAAQFTAAPLAGAPPAFAAAAQFTAAPLAEAPPALTAAAQFSAAPRAEAQHSTPAPIAATQFTAAPHAEAQHSTPAPVATAQLSAPLTEAQHSTPAPIAAAQLSTPLAEAQHSTPAPIAATQFTAAPHAEAQHSTPAPVAAAQFTAAPLADAPPAFAAAAQFTAAPLAGAPPALTAATQFSAAPHAEAQRAAGAHSASPLLPARSAAGAATEPQMRASTQPIRVPGAGSPQPAPTTSAAPQPVRVPGAGSPQPAPTTSAAPQPPGAPPASLAGRASASARDGMTSRGAAARSEGEGRPAPATAPAPDGDEAPADAFTGMPPQSAHTAPGERALHPLSPAPAPGAEIAASVHRQVSHAVALMTDRPVELTLAPEELGRVRLTLSTSDHVVTVSVQAERPETLELIRRNIDHLARDFRDLGYSSVAFNFGERSQQGHAETPMPRPDAEAATARPAPPAAPLAARMPQPAAAAAAAGLDLRL